MAYTIFSLTGRANPQDVLHGMTYGADGYVSKPVRFDALADAIKECGEMRFCFSNRVDNHGNPRLVIYYWLFRTSSMARIFSGLASPGMACAGDAM